MPTRTATARPTSPCPWCSSCTAAPGRRDNYGYNSYHQWLANRGYAVLAVNYRASTGFGKKFLNAGNKRWGLTMHDDLIDAVNWAVKQSVTTADKVAIMGGSYGGYAGSRGRGLHAHHLRLRGGHRRPLQPGDPAGHHPALLGGRRKQIYSRMGDPSTDEGRAILRAASPLYKADQIVRPLLIGQGANDRPRQSRPRATRSLPPCGPRRSRSPMRALPR